jgi:hypothetical protein
MVCAQQCTMIATHIKRALHNSGESNLLGQTLQQRSHNCNN